MLDESLNVITRFVYPSRAPAPELDPLGPLNIDTAGYVWLSLQYPESGRALYDQFTPTLGAVAVCGYNPIPPGFLATPFARGNGSWYYRSFMEGPSRTN